MMTTNSNTSSSSSNNNNNNMNNNNINSCNHNNNNHNNNNNRTTNGDYETNTKPAPLDTTNLNTTMTTTTTNTTTTTTTTTTCDVYISLIQQYITVFQLENALFLIERCLADYPNNYDVIYMQALCYYRLQKYKNAYACLKNNITKHQILLQHQQQQQQQQQQQVQLQNQQGYKLTTNTNNSALPSSTGSGSSSYNSYSTICSMLYLSAQCSYELGDYTSAETSLLQTTRIIYQQQQQQHTTNHYSGSNNNNGVLSIDEWILQSTPCPIPNGAAGLALLGNICRKSNRKERAIQYYYMSLQLDPFLFTSFQALAELGETIQLDAASIFGGKSILNDITNVMSNTNLQTQQYTNEIDQNSTAMNTKTPLQTILSTPTISSINPLSTATTSRSSGFATIAIANTNTTNGRALDFETPGLTPIAHNTTITTHNKYTARHNNNYNTRSSITPLTSNNEVTATVMKQAKQVARRQYYPPSPDAASTSVIATTTTPVTTVTRSMRYLRGLGTTTFNRDTDSMTTVLNPSTTGANRSLFPSPISENHDSNQPKYVNASKSSYTTYNNGVNNNHENKPEIIEKDDSVQEILNILTIAGAAYHNLCQYRCQDTVQLLQRLPISQQRTAWVLHQQGRAFLEKGDFVSAQRSFEYMHSIDPGRMQGLELLSTVYWQLKKEVDLANLAQRTMDWDYLSPHAHCVAGNCFSLQKDQETALVFFKRSLQLDPNFTYIHTLSGYEYMANEDFGKATSCFRKALQNDDRHYNAWYGLGMIYYRQEKYDLAEYHFERAVHIHPTSGVLRCNLGMAQNANGKAYVALETLSEAFRLDPRNPQARFQRATIYSALHRPAEALAELKIVRDAAPREATVHFAMGKILKRLGRLDEAMKCFLTAMDLDPKDNQMIKSAMDKLGEPDGDEDGATSY